MAGFYQLLDGSEYVVALNEDTRPEHAWVETTHVVYHARWQ
jgi:hypothetical protein